MEFGRDCWMDRYGHIYYVPRFMHEAAGEFLLKDEFPIEDINNWEAHGYYRSFTDTLEKRGWVRFTTTINRWNCEHSIGFEDRCPRPSSVQIDKMYELTGFYYDDENTWSQFDRFDHSAETIIPEEEED